jgi:thiamine biosynthesis protein ThiS
VKIILNNREEKFEGNTMTVSEMLYRRKFSFNLRIIKVNDIFIAKEDYSSTLIQDGDKVQMLYLMSGG